MKKSLCIILTLCMLISILTVFASCGKDNTPTDETKGQSSETQNQNTPDKETETRLLPNIPDSYDFNDEVIQVAGWIHDGWEGMARNIRDVVAEEMTGDLVNDAVYSRNAYISEQYHVSFEYEGFDYIQFASSIQNVTKSGDHVWDWCLPLTQTLPGIITADVLTNFHDVPHMDLSKPWYDQGEIADLEVGGVLYALSSAASINDKDATAAIAFNKEAAIDYDLPDLYDMVNKGQWTVEDLMILCDGVLTDLNGDDRYDEEDFYGFLGKHDVAPSFKDGCESLLVTKDQYGFYEFTLGSDKDIDVSEMILEFMNQDFFYNHHVRGIDDATFTRMFATGHGLFFWMRMDEVTNLRASETEFGILPTPKYDEFQKYYRSYVSKNTCSLITIPKTNIDERLEMTGMILEALAAESLYSLQPAYIEQSLITKYARDEESGDMIKLILAHRVFDPGMIYGFGGFNEAYLYIQRQSKGLATLIAEYKSKVDQAIDKFNDTIVAFY